jgi:L-aminopeptidase/D-esterase-like protein
VDAILLTGGSAFGLAAADGVMHYYEKTGRGHQTTAGKVPIVPSVAIYDLGVGDSFVRPSAEQGYMAAVATKGAQVVSGRVGVGAGAYVSHWRGPLGRRAAGLVSHVATEGALVVSVLCAVNAFGDIDFGDERTGYDAIQGLSAVPLDIAGDRAHTVIGVVCTNARLDKTHCHVVAQGAHDGLARAISPPHTRVDGDVFIAAATGEVDAHVDVVRFLALLAVCRAIRSLPTVATSEGLS